MDNEKFQELVLQQLQNITGELKSFNQSVGNLEEGQARLEKDVQGVKESVTRLDMRVENEVENRIRTLFDGYTLRGDQIENLRKHIDERLDNIETDTGYLVSKVARLEKMAK